MKLADLHLHTHFSDGTFSPVQLKEEALKADISCIAVTDHDTIDAISPIRELAADSLEVIAGIELTSQINSKEIHILGYFIDPDSPKLKTELDKIYAIRINRVHDILEKLKKMGISLDADDVFSISGQGTVGRLHIARAMLSKGVVSNIYEAFSKYIGNDGPAYVGKFNLTPKDAIGLIQEAKGIAVLAHPYNSNCDELIPSFVKAGLRGLEVYYPDYPKSVVNYYLQVAEKHGLLLTGGSDCHGIAKPDVKVGKVSIPYELVLKLKKEKYG